MVKSVIQYQGALRCRAVHAPSESEIETDAPVDNMGKGERFSPSDLVATALGSCIATTIGIVAQRKNWDIAGIRVEVTKQMSTEGPRRIVRLQAEVFMPEGFPPELRAEVERIAHTCPVHRSLHPDIDAPVHFYWGSGS